MHIKKSLLDSPLIIALFFAVAILQPSNISAATCLWVSSYHQGYEWNDGIGRGIDRTLQEKCEITRFFMDTKRHPGAEFGRKKGLEAFQLVQTLKPDVVIASDDNASRYFVKPYLQDAYVPVVFCGVNWSVEEYGYPYNNATGMVEFAPVMPLFNEIKRTLRNPSKGLYLSSDVKTEHTDSAKFKTMFAGEGVKVETYFVSTIDKWEEGYLKGQSYDFIILGNNGGINDWNKKRALLFALKNAGALTVTNYDWMMPYAMLAKTKIPDEQGEWAGNVAVEIIQGMDPGDIPIVPNRRWNLLVNMSLLKKAGIKLPQDFLVSAIKVQP
jgi:ABC-type uncharacterized transport system substrate-binding protein